MNWIYHAYGLWEWFQLSTLIYQYLKALSEVLKWVLTTYKSAKSALLLSTELVEMWLVSTQHFSRQSFPASVYSLQWPWSISQGTFSLNFVISCEYCRRSTTTGRELEGNWHVHLTRVTRKQTLRSLSLSYQKKDGRAWPCPSFFWHDTDFFENLFYDVSRVKFWLFENLIYDVVSEKKRKNEKKEFWKVGVILKHLVWQRQRP